MKMGSVTINDKEARDIIRKCLNKATYFGNSNIEYEIIARAFAELFYKKNPKFNAHLFVKRCATDYKGNEIYCHN